MDPAAQEKLILLTTPIQPLPNTTNDSLHFICELRHLLSKPATAIKKGSTLHLWGMFPWAHNTTITGTVGKIVKHNKHTATIKIDEPNQQSNVALYLRLPISLLEIPHMLRLQRSLESLIPRETSPPLEVKTIM